MAGRIFEVAFRINGALNSQFGAAMRAAQETLRNVNQAGVQTNTAMNAASRSLQGYLARLNQTSESAERFRRLKQSVTETSAAIQAAQQRANQTAAAFRAQQTATNQLKARLDALKATYDAQRNSLPRAELQALRAQIRQTTTEWRAAENATRTASREFDAARGRVTGLRNTLQAQQAALQREREALREAGFSTQNFAQNQTNLRREIERTTRTIEEQARVQNGLSTARTNAGNAGANLGVAAAGMMGAVYTAQNILSPFTGAVQTAADFEKTMSQVQAITGATGAEFASLNAKAKELGASTQFSASQAGEAMTFLGMAGWKTQEILSGLPGLLNLAAAGGTDLAQTADIVSDGLTAFNMSAAKSDHFADVMAATATNANTNVALMGETFKYAGAVAGSLGYSIEDVALATGLMGNASIKGSMAGTALRSVMTRLVKPPSDAAKALTALNVSATNSDGTMKPFRETLKDLRREFAGLSEAEKASRAAQIAGQEAMAGFLAIMNASEEDFSNLEASIDNSRGAANKFAQTATNNLSGALTALASATEGLQIAVGEVFLPTLTDLAKGITANVGELVEWVGKHKEATKAAGLLAAAVSSLIVAAAGIKLAFAVGGYISAQFALARASVEAFTAGVSPLGATMSNALATAGTAFASLRARIVAEYTTIRALTWSQIGANISGAFTAARTNVTAALASIRARAAAARVSMMGFFSTLSMSSIISTATGALGRLGTAIAGVGRSALAFVASPLGVALLALGLAAYFIYENWEKLSPIFEELAGQIGGALTDALTTLQPALDTLKEAFSNMATTLLPLFQDAWAQISAVFADNSETFSLLATIVGGVLVGALIVFANVLTGVVVTAISTATTIISTIIAVIGDVINFVTNVFTGQWSAAWENVVSIFGNIFGGIKGIVDNVLGGITSTIGNIGKSIGNLLNIGGGGGGGASVAHNAVGGIYPKGAFLTTFAENSPEAAIPIDGSQRAVGLWERVGKMLGVYPGIGTPDVGGSQPGGMLTSVAPAAKNGGGGISLPAINVSININGNANAEDVKRGAENGVTSALNNFAEQFASLMHERRRVSYA